jgi:glutathionyl-hydroquinone reductase
MRPISKQQQQTNKITQTKPKWILYRDNTILYRTMKMRLWTTVILIYTVSHHFLCNFNKLRNYVAGQWWCKPLIPALGRQRQADF